ncbi:hypothetical protein ACRAWD_19010 [Caulobacter segnis]
MAAEATSASARLQVFDGVIDTVTIEQRGPVRAVVRFEGKHRGAGRDWLPFTLRVAVDAEGRLTLTHSFVFDGDGNKDFIAGLGIRFDVPLTDELHNRHVRFAGEGEGMWGEAVRNIPGWQPNKFALAGKFRGPAARRSRGGPLGHGRQDPRPTADRACLERLSPRSKGDAGTPSRSTSRPTPRSSWLPRRTTRGRAPGLGYVGGVSGGVAFGLRHFWQRHPAGLEIENATTGRRDRDPVACGRLRPGPWTCATTATAPTGWRSSTRTSRRVTRLPRRRAHQPGLPLARGRHPDARRRCPGMAKATTDPTLPVACAGLLSQLRRLRPLGPVDRPTPVKARLDGTSATCWPSTSNEGRATRRWYGFWDHGDVMHTYDQDRHVWRYDVGGYAWDNSELVPDLWLWTAFMRTGRADIFRMAEAMTRHTGEVDQYHLGPFKWAGLAPNVSHWGDGAKEARISQSLLRRHYYPDRRRAGPAISWPTWSTPTTPWPP